MSTNEFTYFNTPDTEDLSWLDQIEEPEPEQTEKPAKETNKSKFTAFCREEYNMTVDEFTDARLVACYEDTLRYLLRVESKNRMPLVKRKIGRHQTRALVKIGVLSKGHSSGKAYVSEERLEYYLSLPCNLNLYDPNKEDAKVIH